MDHYMHLNNYNLIHDTKMSGKKQKYANKQSNKEKENF